MRVSVLVAALLTCLVSTLTPLAFASPPDPTWIGGFWDDDDYDDVIILITGKIHAVAIAPLVVGEWWGDPFRLEEAPRHDVAFAQHSASDPRAPPAAPAALS